MKQKRLPITRTYDVTIFTLRPDGSIRDRRTRTVDAESISDAIDVTRWMERATPNIDDAAFGVQRRCA